MSCKLARTCLRVGLDVKVRGAGREVVRLAVLWRNLDLGLQGHHRLIEVTADRETAVVERPVRVLELERTFHRPQTEAARVNMWRLMLSGGHDTVKRAGHSVARPAFTWELVKTPRLTAVMT